LLVFVCVLYQGAEIIQPLLERLHKTREIEANDGPALRLFPPPKHSDLSSDEDDDDETNDEKHPYLG